MKFGLLIRAYAPFAQFGLLFHGDNRGPTTSSNVTSRVKAWTTFDPVAGVVGPANAKSDESSWIIPGTDRDTAIPIVRLEGMKIGPNTLHFHLHAAGSNPLIKGSPSIDMRITATVAIGKGHLGINADLSGDAFPNAEVIVQDEGGQRRMVMSYETSGGRDTGPFVRLPGNRQAAMNAICCTFGVSPEGRFI